MNRNFYDEQDLRNEKSSGSSSSRKGKRSSANNNSGANKPKQPQRGLGVAQLEKIRLHSEMGYNTYLQPADPPSLLHHVPNYQEDMGFQATYSSIPSSSSSSFGHHGQKNFMIGFGEPESENMGTIERWNPNILETQHFAPPMAIPHFLHQVDDSKQNKREKGRNNGSIGSGSQNSDTSDTRELDLELRLSLYPP